MITGRRRNRTLCIAAALVALALGALYLVRVPVLRQFGGMLIHSDPLGPADAIVITLDSGAAGALEAADLVKAGFATSVAVFADSPTTEAQEFARRGLPYQGPSARQIEQLRVLGIKDVQAISPAVTGSTDEVDELPRWCVEHAYRSVILVATSDHSYRLHRALRRSTASGPLRINIRPSRYSSFHPDRWWQSRDGRRTAIVELQKLMLEMAAHPLD